MKRMIPLALIVIACVAAAFVGFGKNTVVLNGVLLENNQNINVSVCITGRNCDKIFNRMSGHISAYNEEMNYEYKFSGRIFAENGSYFAPVYRKNDVGLASQGYLCFDKNMKNAVLFTDKEKIYAAEPNFVDKAEASIKIISN